MDRLHQLFLAIFTDIYPYIYNHFVSYLLILVILVSIAYWNWQFLKKALKKKKGSLLVKVGLLCSQASLMTFIAWFCLIHFHTYRVLP